MLEVKWLEAGKDAACGSSRESTQRQPWLLVRHCARREDDYSWWVAAAGISLEVKSWLPLSVKRYCLVLAVCGGSMSIASLIPMPFMSSLPQKRAG